MKFRILLYLLFSILFVFLIIRIYNTLTDDFRLSHITYEMPYQQEWQLGHLSAGEEQKLEEILSQPFTYLGKGAQSYVFESSDGLYVLKFFKFKHLRPSWFIEALPPLGFIKTYQSKQAVRRERKLWGVFRAYKLAYDVNKQESGLVFIQLNIRENPMRYVTIIDKIGFKRILNLADYAFIIQKKGQTLQAVLDRLLSQGESSEASKRIGEILEMYAEEYGKGVYDHDHNVMRNTGFLGESPIHLDVGKLAKDESMRQSERAWQDALLVAAHIKRWIHRHYPQDEKYLETFIDKKMAQLFTSDCVQIHNHSP